MIARKKSPIEVFKHCPMCQCKAAIIITVLIIFAISGPKIVENAAFCYVAKMFADISCTDLLNEEAKQNGR